MSQNSKEMLNQQTPDWLVKMLPLISLVLSLGSIWYAWLKYNNMLEQGGFYWYNWIQLAMMLLVSILCFSAAFLYILGKPSAKSVLMGGLAVIPFMLFTNLVVLIFRAIHNIVDGNAKFFFERILEEPHKLLFIPFVIIALTLLDALIKKDKK